MFKAFRIFILLLILLVVGVSAWKARTQSVAWKHDLPVNLYLINADGSSATQDYINTLTLADFKPVEQFFLDEAKRYGRQDRAGISLSLGNAITEIPPAPPMAGNILQNIGWSLNFRWWAFRHAETSGPAVQVRMFLLFFEHKAKKVLPHSTGLQKGLLGRVNLFASNIMAEQNNIVITHELLHTLGATDKYDLASGQPIYPDGYADPDRQPLLPQHYAEIMAGKVALNSQQSSMPNTLNQVLIGQRTAQEINWLQAD